ncbi:hypothetical protein [Pseudodesulfovibrio senegalensis]|uniref:Uncharacterized protein n=1 Tax=Pseudodesulfovibrio senegalensis TaxID=1721087 RepID=A0A6N6N278_9BACT|nr:hypothetical protein [Pseudodesulfovibrio senegalensis]KAB1441677.1 hypothetical protein F8A88_08755 [Pseudodesulfovibrio senegalensis]
MMKTYVLSMVMLCLFACGCSAQDSEGLSASGPGSEYGQMQQRMDQLERKVKALQAENRETLSAIRRDLDVVRAQLTALSELLGQAELPESGSAPDEDLDKSARSFAKDSLKRMLDLSRKLMQKLENELDKSLNQPEAPSQEPEPEGEKSI